MKLMHLFAALLAACSAPTLEKQVEQAASHCPVEVKGVGFIKNISLDKDTLVYDVTVTSPSIDLSRLSSRPDEVKATMKSSIVNLFDNNHEMITDISDTDNMIMFHCEVDETTANADAIDNLRTHAAEIAAEMAESLSGSADPDVKRMVGIAMRADHGIAYRYTGSVSGDTVTIAFPAARLRMMR